MLEQKRANAKLDVIITHYNEPWEVGRKLFDSIYIQECCNFDDVNFILVQDGEDNALPWTQLLKNYPFDVNVVSLPNHVGVAGARNKGIECASSDWIMFMDFDDLFADACAFSQILSIFPVTADVDIIWSKYVREVNGHGRLKIIALNKEDEPDFRLVGKIFRRAFLNEKHIRFIEEHEEYCDMMFNYIALAETYDHKFVNFSSPFYPFIKRLREDGAFSTIDVLGRKVSGIVDRDIILVNEMLNRMNDYKYRIWVARTVIDSYHSIVSANIMPDPHYGINNRLVEFWKHHREAYFSVTQPDIEVAVDSSLEEVMTYIQEYYNNFHEEFYLQNDMITLNDFVSKLDSIASADDIIDEDETKHSTQANNNVQMMPSSNEQHRDDRVVVYCGTKETYVNMVASVKSLLATTPVDKVYFLIEDNEFPYDLPDIIETRNVSETGLFDPDGPNYDNVWTYMCLMRTAFPQMFPQYNKVLSLDIDVVITEDISNLWDIDLTDYYFAGVEEQGHKKTSEKDFYANFGVIMMNLDKLRKDGIGDKLIDAVNTEHFVCPEQDAFSKYCKGHMYKLPNDYNVTVYSHITGEPMKERILHYAGLKYWKHFGPVKKYFNMPWDEIMRLHDAAKIQESMNDE